MMAEPIPSTPGLPRPLTRIARAAACIGGTVGSLVLAGWAFDIATLKSIVPGFIAMQPWTATSFILCACGLAMAAARSPAVVSASALPAVAMALIAGAPLLQYLTGYTFGIDGWLFPKAVLVAQTHDYPDPGRMSWAAAVGFTALAGALLLAPHAKQRVSHAAFSILPTAALALSMLALLGYALRLETLDAMFLRNPLALHTAFTLAALSIGVLVLRPDVGWVRMAAEQGPGGWMTVILFGGGALFLAFSTDASTRAGTIAASAAQASRRLESLASALTAAENGQRGYLLTGNESELDAYRMAVNRVAEECAAAAAPLTAVTEQPTDLTRLRDLVALKLAGLARAITLAQAGHAAEARAIVAANQDKALMDSIDQQVSLLEQVVAHDAGTLALRARRVAMSGAAGTIAIAGLAFWTFAAEGRARTAAAAALAASEARQRDLLITLDLGTFMARDLAGIIHYWAEGCERLYGWTAAEAVGQPAHQMLGTVFSDPLAEVEATLLHTGEWKGDLRQRTRDGRELVVTAHKVLRRAVAGEPQVVLEALTDVTAQRRAEAALRDSQRLLRTIIEATPGLIYARDVQGRMLVANSAAAALLGKPRVGMPGQADQPLPDDAARDEIIMGNDRQVMQRGQPQQHEEQIGTANGQPRVWLSTKTPMRGTDGTVTGLVGVSVEITQRKRDEERLHLMVNELNHRVKNTLVVVQSIILQTLRGGEGEIYRTLEGRLQALAAIHDVLTLESWKDAHLHAVVEAALAPFGGSAEPQFQTSGPAIRVQPRVAVAIAMALHELATNAAIYGALSTSSGKVALHWQITPDAEPCLHMVWSEQGGPRVDTQAPRGFGTRLIERGLSQDLGGTVTLLLNPTGVTCTIHAPLREVAAGCVISFPHIGASRLASASPML